MADVWPKRIELPCGLDKSEMWDHAEKLGLTGDAVQRFKYALGDVQATIEVNEDGTYKILSVRE